MPRGSAARARAAVGDAPAWRAGQGGRRNRRTSTTLRADVARLDAEQALAARDQSRAEDPLSRRRRVDQADLDAARLRSVSFCPATARSGEGAVSRACPRCATSTCRWPRPSSRRRCAPRPKPTPNSIGRKSARRLGRLRDRLIHTWPGEQVHDAGIAEVGKTPARCTSSPKSTRATSRRYALGSMRRSRAMHSSSR